MSVFSQVLSVLAIVLLLTAEASFGQAPEGWFLTGEYPDEYVLGTDSVVFLEGRSAGFIRATSDTVSVSVWATVAQRIRADEYRGRRVRFSAFVRTETAGQALLWMRVDGPGDEVLAFDNMQDRPIRNSDWWEFEIVLDVPDVSDVIAFGLVLMGEGTAWIDAARLREVGTVPGARPSERAAPAESSPDRLERLRRLPTRPVNMGFEPPSGAGRN